MFAEFDECGELVFYLIQDVGLLEQLWDADVGVG